MCVVYWVWSRSIQVVLQPDKLVLSLRERSQQLLKRIHTNLNSLRLSIISVPFTHLLQNSSRIQASRRNLLLLNLCCRLKITFSTLNTWFMAKLELSRAHTPRANTASEAVLWPDWPAPSASSSSMLTIFTYIMQVDCCRILCVLVSRARPLNAKSEMCAYEQKVHAHQSIGVANKTLYCDTRRLYQATRSIVKLVFSPISTVSLYIRVAQAPRCGDLAISWQTDSDCFTPCACAQDNMRKKCNYYSISNYQLCGYEVIMSDDEVILFKIHSVQEAFSKHENLA